MSIYQKGVWFLKGMGEYTKSGYTAAAKHFNKSDLEKDVSGQVFMITGANSGIGKSAAKEIAKKGGEVHLVCRNPERAENARKEIVETSGNSKIHVHILDTSKLGDVHRFAQTFLKDHDQLNVLINNAGCMINDRTVTDDNLEANFATNTMGTFILTEGLLPLLEKTSNSRVIVVSSGGMLTSKLNVKDFQSEKGRFEGTEIYAQNKRQQVIFTEEWAKLHHEVHFSSMHPGWADTPAVRTSMPGFYEKMQNRLRSEEQGSDTIVWLAISDAALSTQSGQFFQDRKPVSTHLPLAWTHESKQDRETLIKTLHEIKDRTEPSAQKPTNE